MTMFIFFGITLPFFIAISFHIKDIGERLKVIETKIELLNQRKND